jgi:uncharacterized protein (TIGR02145 family)
MKKSTIIIFLMLAMLKTQAQDYLISFTGSGDTTVVGSVKVYNLMSGATVTLNEGDILHLIPAVGIGTLDNSNGTLKIYPNPMVKESMLTFIATEKGNAVICIVDLSGKTVYQISTLLSPGAYSFLVSGLSQGIYFVKVTGKNYNYSSKLISQSNLQNVTRIEYVSSDMNYSGYPLKNIAATIDMPYTDGDRLLYKGTADIYTTIATDIPTSSETITFYFDACTDNDGNNYAITEIGTQIWMAENLNVGVRLNGTQEQINNGVFEKYCYNDDEDNCDTYGGLYQWNEIMEYDTTAGTQGICPNGWHIPKNAEWSSLKDFLEGEEAGGKMKETGTVHWAPPNTGATNESGFTALPSGDRSPYGPFDELATSAFFWSSNQLNIDDAYDWDLLYDKSHLYGTSTLKTYGLAVRCILD